MSSGEYGHILLAVDFEDESQQVIERGCRLRDLFGTRLTLLHVVGHIPQGVEYSIGISPGEVILPEGLDLEKELVETAQAQLDILGERIGVPQQHRLIRLGRTSRMILDTARELNADLIVIGAHERHGLFALLGAVSPSVVKREVCDVLTVHIDAEEANS